MDLNLKLLDAALGFLNPFLRLLFGPLSGKAYQYTVEASPMQRALWYALATTGMRRGEICGLTWPRTDLKRGILHVRDTRVMISGSVAASKWKTKRGRRDVSIDASVVAVLREWKARQSEDRLLYGDKWEDDADHVFTHAVYLSRPVRYGVAIRPDWVTSKFRKLAADAGLPPLTPHGLRHSWATAALVNGEVKVLVSDHLGHADSSVTDRVYRHIVQRAQDATAQRVSALITGSRAAKADRNGTETG